MSQQYTAAYTFSYSYINSSLPVSSAILFYLAKKRQWAVRASLRRSARRVTSTLKSGSRTPRDRTTFSNLDKQPPSTSSSSGGSRSPPQAKRQHQHQHQHSKSQPQRHQPSPAERQQRQDRKSKQAIARAKEAVARDSAGSAQDLEKGLGTRSTVVTPESQFDMDSPEVGKKGKWWGLGRKG